jgi:putative hydrolase of the HAD superfamily
VPVDLLAGARAVFFDAVGTLLFPDPPAAEIYAAVAERHDLRIRIEDVRRRFLAAYRAEEHVDRVACWVTSENREAMRWRRIVGESLDGVRDPESCFRELFQHFGQPSAWRVHPQACEVVDGLRAKGIRMGIGSNYDARLLSVVAGFKELRPLMDSVVVSSRVGYRKPAAEFFQEVTRVAGCEPGQILFVGDDVEDDYEGARRAGLRSVLFAPTRLGMRGENELTDLREILA